MWIDETRMNLVIHRSSCKYRTASKFCHISHCFSEHNKYNIRIANIISYLWVTEVTAVFIWNMLYWHSGDTFSLFLSIFYISQRLTLWYFVFLYLIFLSQQVLYFLLSTLVLTLYIDVVLSLSIEEICYIDLRYVAAPVRLSLSCPYVTIEHHACNHCALITSEIHLYSDAGYS